MSELAWVTQSQVQALGLIQSASVTLTDETIKALPTTTAVIIPASTQENQIPMPLLALIRVSGDLDTFVPYDTVHNPVGLFLVLGDYDFVLSTPMDGGSAANAGQLFTNSNRTFLFSGLNQDNGLNVSSLTDNSLRIVADNGGDGDFTGGDAGNEMTLTIYYTLADLS